MKLLIVDDHPILRDGLRICLAYWFPDAAIAEAGSGPEAIDLATRTQPDAAIVDLGLPGMQGVELIHRLHGILPRLAILVLAGVVERRTVRESLAAGARGYLGKNQSARHLREAIVTIIRGERFLCREAAALVESGEAADERCLPTPSVLSSREREILVRLVHGETTKSIAAALGISPKTVETHRVHLHRKLGTDNLAALTHYAIRHGLRPL